MTVQQTVLEIVPALMLILSHHFSEDGNHEWCLTMMALVMRPAMMMVHSFDGACNDNGSSDLQ